LYKGFIFLLFAALLASCASERHAAISWEGQKVRVALTPPGGSTLFSSPAIECKSCDEVLPPIPLDENSDGIAFFRLAAASTSIATSFRVNAAGLDSVVLLQPMSEAQAEAYYKPSNPIRGRILVVSFAHVYKDSTMGYSIGTLERGMEANLFRENDVFYFIHHPMYDHPVVVLRSDAIRLR
jgi:hypothetical protein